jgi:hypothetical protein
LILESRHDWKISIPQRPPYQTIRSAASSRDETGTVVSRNHSKGSTSFGGEISIVHTTHIGMGGSVALAVGGAKQTWA